MLREQEEEEAELNQQPEIEHKQFLRRPNPNPQDKQVCVKLMVANMMDSHNSWLVLLCRSLQQMNVDICLATETRIPAAKVPGTEIHTRHALGYDIFCTYTTTQNQGRLALIVRNDGTKTNWTVESPQRHGPNVLSCLLISGSRRTPLIGAYLPPSCTAHLKYLTEAFNHFPPTLDPILLSNLNADITKLRRATSGTTHLQRI